MWAAALCVGLAHGAVDIADGCRGRDLPSCWEALLPHMVTVLSVLFSLVCHLLAHSSVLFNLEEGFITYRAAALLVCSLEGRKQDVPELKLGGKKITELGIAA